MSQTVGLKPFRAVLERPNEVGSWTFLFMPFDVATAFGKRGRVAVRGTIDGVEFRGSLMPRDGRHYLMVNKELRTAIGKDAPEEVLVVIEPDDQPRVVSIPDVLTLALAKNAAATAIFERLSYSHKKEYVDWIEGAKKAETRAQRAEKAVEMVLERKGVKNPLPKG
jgi:hypothetical protein